MNNVWKRAAGAGLTCTAAVSVVLAPGAGVASAAAGCPKLYVLGVQGTGQSESDADPSIDAGMLASVMKPLMTMAGSKVARAYVPYPAGFGGAVAGGQETFEKSVEKGVARTTGMTKQIKSKCPGTKLAYVGYSQGAYVVSLVLKDIAKGSGPVSADDVAGAALLGDPTRPTDSGLFPGKPGATTPDAAPGTSGEAVAEVPPRSGPTPTGGGVGPEREQQTDYGPLNGRVASICETGDLACDAPADAPITHIVANVAGQTKVSQDDPVQTLGSIAEALAMTSAKTIVPVINEDVQGETVEDLTYQPNQSISQRMATASDPRTPLPSVDESLRALLKVGTIGLNAVVAVARKVLTPSTLTQLGAVGLANPAAGLGLLGAKVLEATVELVPPATTSRWTSEAFDAVKANVSDNKELLNVANLARYWQTAQQHGSYAKPTSAGQSAATMWVATWFASVAADLAGQSFTALDGNGNPAADPQLGDFYAPTLPLTSSTSSAPFPTGDPSETAPWATGTLTITDHATDSASATDEPSDTSASEPVPSN